MPQQNSVSARWQSLSPRARVWSMVATVMVMLMVVGAAWAWRMNRVVEAGVQRSNALVPTAEPTLSMDPGSTWTPTPVASPPTSSPRSAPGSYRPLPPGVTNTVSPVPTTGSALDQSQAVTAVPSVREDDEVAIVPARPLSDHEDVHSSPRFVPARGADPAVPVKKRPGSMTYLMIGSDTRGTERGRSDVILVVHTSADNKRVDVVHVPRDLYVRVPGKGYDKINAAYAAGGAPLLSRTVAPLMGVPIDHVAQIDFARFERAIDAVGGVDVKVPDGAGNKDYVAGRTYHLDGRSALWFVRDRKSLNQGDISRGKRQAAVLKAVMSQAIAPSTIANPARMERFLRAGSSSVTIDSSWSVPAIRDAGVRLGMARPVITTWTAPWSGAGRAPNGRSVVWSAKAAQREMAARMSSDTMAGYRDRVSPTRGFGR